MKVLRESDYAYLHTRYRRNKNLGMVLSIVGIPPIILGSYFTNWIALFLGLLLASIGVVCLASSRNYRAGIEGEQAVVKALQVLDDSYSIINDFKSSVKSGNIDHILICPKGVFVIETKNYSGDIRCYGERWSKKVKGRLYDIRSVSYQAKNNAKYLSDLIHGKTNLSLFVEPICVFTNPSMKLKIYKPTVAIRQVDGLAEFIMEFQPKTTITDSEIQMVAKCILDAHSE